MISNWLQLQESYGFEAISLIFMVEYIACDIWLHLCLHSNLPKIKFDALICADNLDWPLNVESWQSFMIVKTREHLLNNINQPHWNNNSYCITYVGHLLGLTRSYNMIWEIWGPFWSSQVIRFTSNTFGLESFITCNFVVSRHHKRAFAVQLLQPTLNLILKSKHYHSKQLLIIWHKLSLF